MNDYMRASRLAPSGRHEQRGEIRSFSDDDSSEPKRKNEKEARTAANIHSSREHADHVPRKC